MKLQKRSGFTLIELLVVITIIGILATGGIAVFTTQLQGARDSTRFNDLKLMESAVGQYHADNTKYPGTGALFTTAISPFTNKTLTDPKSGQTLCWNDGGTTNSTVCNGYYWVEDDTYGLPLWTFKLGVRFEKSNNKQKWAGDGGTTWTGVVEVFGGSGGSGVTLDSTSIY